MSNEKVLLQCYNRGCGQKFDPNDNKDGDCAHHPGYPVFHDAYKSWSCCKKKCTDFTEFLNINGCTKSFHSNEKPVVPEKPPLDKTILEEATRTKPVSVLATKRPPFDTTRISLKPVVSPAFLEQVEKSAISRVEKSDDTRIQIGQNCQNKSCKATYQGSESITEVCVYHPGVPIFHEGLKYWSCCKKKSTDFSVFLAQPGCMEGVHEWIAKNLGKNVNCRMDWHQTGSFVVISIFAKKYQPDRSTIQLNPIRLSIDLFFMEENSKYNLDIELAGLVDVEQSSVSMLPTKVEIKLRKAEPGSWPKLSIPRSSDTEVSQENKENDQINDRVEAVDLNDL